MVQTELFPSNKLTFKERGTMLCITCDTTNHVIESLYFNFSIYINNDSLADKKLSSLFNLSKKFVHLRQTVIFLAIW